MCDLRPEVLDALGRRFPAVRQTQDLDEMLEDESVDAVAVVTPVSTHHDLAMRALNAGKHVFVEKPLASSSDLAVDLIRATYEHDLVLMPGHTFLYSPPVNRIRELIRAGELGEIYFISMSRVNLGLYQSDVSVIWDLGPHDFSILLYWLDERPSQVVSTGRACIDKNEDVAFITCAFDSGTIAHVELSWLAPSKLRRTTVVGSKKMVVYDDCSNEPVRVYDAGVMPRDPESFGEFLKYRTGDIVSPHIESSEPIALQMDDFCRAIRAGTTPTSSAHLGLDVVRMIEAADRHFSEPNFLSGLRARPIADRPRAEGRVRVPQPGGGRGTAAVGTSGPWPGRTRFRRERDDARWPRRLFRGVARPRCPDRVRGLRHRADPIGLARAVRLAGARSSAVLTHSVSAHLVGHVLARRQRAAHVVTEHLGADPLGMRPLRRHQQLLLRPVRPRANAVVAAALSQTERLVRDGYPPDAIRVIANGVETDPPVRDREAVRAELGVAPSAFLAVLVAALRPEKCVPVFVEQVSAAHAIEPSVQGVVVGDGPDGQCGGPSGDRAGPCACWDTARMPWTSCMPAMSCA